MLVKDYVEQNQDTDYEFVSLLPTTCPDIDCGSPLEMSDALTTLHCSNPRCTTRLVKRMTAMMAQLGVKGVGKEVARAFFRKFHMIQNPLLILGYTYGDPAENPNADGEIGVGVGMKISEKIYDQLKDKKKFTLWEFVRLANLPNIQSSALQIFGAYDDLNKAYADIHAGGVDFIRDKLGVEKGTGDDTEIISLRAMKVYETLMTFEQDLKLGVRYVTIVPVNTESVTTISAVCSDEVGGRFTSKTEFYNYVNNNLNESTHVNFMPSVTKKIDYLIWNGAELSNFAEEVESGVDYISLPSGTSARVTSKVKKVLKYNSQYKVKEETNTLTDKDKYIEIVTAEVFLQKMGIQ